MPADGPWWGFHRLDAREAARLVADAGIRRGQLVLDLGAGDGAITRHLVAAGARVIAFELHPERAASLRSRFAGRPVKVVQADVRDLRLPGRPFSVVANPPFAATTAMLRRVLSPPSLLSSAELVVPAHVAARWAQGRGPGSGAFDVAVRRRVAAAAFRPPAPCATSVLVIRRLQ